MTFSQDPQQDISQDSTQEPAAALKEELPKEKTAAFREFEEKLEALPTPEEKIARFPKKVPPVSENSGKQEESFSPNLKPISILLHAQNSGANMLSSPSKRVDSKKSWKNKAHLRSSRSI